MARPEGLEPPAYWFEANRSIQLSYGRVYETVYIVSPQLGTLLTSESDAQEQPPLVILRLLPRQAEAESYFFSADAETLSMKNGRLW